MRYQSVVVTGLLVASMHAHGFQNKPEQTLPLQGGRPVVATVNGTAISLDELVTQLGPVADMTRLRQGQGKPRDFDVLDRLINIKLIVQEAATMGLDEAPEIEKQVEVSSRAVLRDVLFERILKGVTADPVVVEKLYRESVREWKTTPLLFQDKAAAGAARNAIADGGSFDDVAAKAIAAKTARTEGDNGYHPRTGYLPQIADAIARLRTGQVSPVISIQAGFVIVKVVAIRYPENPTARAEAKRMALAERQQAVLKAHEETLKSQYAVVNKAVLKSLDYEAPKPGIDALLKDTRVVTEIKGGPPVTVGDLTDYLRMQFFHGTDQVRQRQEMNEKKVPALDATIGRRLLNIEAVKLGIDKTNVYKDRVTAYRDSLVFDAFVQKVIMPDSKMREEEVRAYYNGHPKEYSYPEMMRVRGLAFARRDAAEAAMRKLREGADYGWLASNADGQVDKGADGPLTFDGRPVTTTSMPDGVQKALAGSKGGESRLYASPDGRFYVLGVQQVIAANPKPYDEVREEIAKKLYGEKLKKGVEEYAAKLKAHSKIQTYLKRMQ